jgi:nitrite reductase/ring-hydroxylating ferredoxin subunit
MEPIHPEPLDRNPELVVAGVYQREVGASLERVWENVHDWEHLPWLHREAFTSIERLASGDWGWRAEVGLTGGALAQIELVTDPEQLRYVARTIEGAGAPSEIWTSLEPVAEDRTAIEVELCVCPLPQATLQKLGEGFVDLYTRLWDQDEGMMQTRSRALDARGMPTFPTPPTSARRPMEETPPLDLGSLDAIRDRLPVVFEFAGASFRLVALGDEILAHSVQCPHLLGPLDQCDVENGEITCPWHGYRFDVRTGRSSDGHTLRLRSAPRIEVDAVTAHLVAHPSRPIA